MKKFLLFGLACLSTLSVFAQDKLATQDPADYETINGVQLTNRWLNARSNNRWDGALIPFYGMYNKARTATIAGDKALVGYSKTVDGTDTAHIVVYDLADGFYEKEVMLTEFVDSTQTWNPIKGLLCANQIGTDQFGHVYIGGYQANVGTTPIVVYVIDDMDTGRVHRVAELTFPATEDAATKAGRMDYFHVIGDITGEKAGAVLMTALSNTKNVHRWMLEEGGTEWYGGFDGKVAMNTDALTTYPADQTSWSTGAVCTMVLDSEFSGEMFYIDGNTTYPALYNTTGVMLDSFEDATDVQPQDVAQNGVAELTLEFTDENGEGTGESKAFLIYAINQYNKGNGWESNICEFGEGMAFAGMTKYWTFPAAGLGKESDGGQRVHNLMTQAVKDKNGKNGFYIFNFKCNAGFGVYCLAEEGFEDANVGVEDIVAEEAGEAVYYNLQGVKVANPENGLYIVKRGNKATKEVVVK